MAKLRFLLNEHLLGEYPLDKQRLTIGRRPSCDIQIDNLTISGEHAVVITSGNSSYVKDLNSMNGTMVNNQSIQKHVLFNKDVIEFGDYKIHYSDDSQTDIQDSNGFEKTVMIKKSVITKKSVIQSPPQEPIIQKVMATTNQPASTATTLKRVTDHAESLSKLDKQGRLKVLNGKGAGRELKLDKAMVSFGKPGIQVAVIIKRPKGYFITHIEGECYPTVNGKQIGVQAQSLQHLDVVELAGTKMEFNLV